MAWAREPLRWGLRKGDIIPNLTRAELRSRWNSESGLQLALEVLSRLTRGDELAGLGLDEHDGRVDLRYLQSPTPKVLRRFGVDGWNIEELGNCAEFKDCQLMDLDLSGACLTSLRFHNTRVTNCRFESADCRDWRLWNTSLRRCSLSHANMRETALGTWKEGRRNVWHDIDFVGADLRRSHALGAVFEVCDFSNAKFDATELQLCTLVDCVFAGEIEEVVFDYRPLKASALAEPMRNVDFTHARFNYVEFLGGDLSGIALPDDPDLRLVRHFPCTARAIAQLLANDDRAEAKSLVEYLEHTGFEQLPPKSDYVFNRRVVTSFGGPECRRLFDEVLPRAEMDCR